MTLVVVVSRLVCVLSGRFAEDVMSGFNAYSDQRRDESIALEHNETPKQTGSFLGNPYLTLLRRPGEGRDRSVCGTCGHINSTELIAVATATFTTFVVGTAGNESVVTIRSIEIVVLCVS